MSIQVLFPLKFFVVAFELFVLFMYFGLLDILFAHIFSHSVGNLPTVLTVAVKKIFCLMSHMFAYFCFGFTSLVKIINKFIILFDTVINGIFFKKFLFE